MNTRNVIVSLLAGILVLVVGFGIGIFYSKSPKVQTQNSAQATPQVVKDLSSKVISSISAYGTVARIDGRILTLSYQGSSMELTIRDDAKVYSFTSSIAKPGGKATPVTKEIAFSDIKVGSNVSANVKVLGDGQIEGYSVIVSPTVK